MTGAVAGAHVVQLYPRHLHYLTPPLPPHYFYFFIQVMTEISRRLAGSIPDEGSVREQTFQKRELVVIINSNPI